MQEPNKKKLNYKKKYLCLLSLNKLSLYNNKWEKMLINSNETVHFANECS